MPLDLARPRRRLVVPASRAEPRETIVTAPPFFLRGPGLPANAPPALLSFEGADFLNDFLAAARDPARLPKLLAWRDWAEPPSGALDTAGRPRYPVALRRAAPIAIEPETGVGPDGVPAGDPAWFRKLYLPLHTRFTLTAFDLVCRRLGFPPVDRARVLGAGVVVRRLRPDPARLRWEDWISADGKRGVWTELATPIEALDPQAVAPAAFAGQEVALRARLGLPATAPLPAALDSARLLPLQPDAAGRNCTLYGYVPVFSAAEQAGDAAPASPAEMVATLQGRATAALQAAADGAPVLAAKLRAALAGLLAETVLPPRPTTAAVSTAWTTVRGFVGSVAQPFPPGGDVAGSALTLDRGLRTLLVAGFSALAPAQVDADALDPDAPETAAAWILRARVALGPLASGAADRAALFGSIWGAENIIAHPGAWITLWTERLHGLATTILDGAAIPQPVPGQQAALDGDDLAVLLACAMLRLRVLRIALAATLRRQMFGAEAELASLTALRDGMAQQTPGALGVEIAAALGLEAWRGTPDAPGWPPLDTATPPGSTDRRAYRAHEAAWGLDEAYAAFEAGVAAAGTAFDEEQEARLATRAGAMASRLGQPVAALRAAGFEIREQPARGLFGIPGFAPTAFAIASLGIPVAARYADQAVALRVSRDEARVQRLRYDHDNLYAIWCWARIAGHAPCEKEQIVWTPASEPFSVAEPSDVLGARPASIQLPDIPRLIRDIPRIAKARARPFAAVAAPPDSSYITGDAPQDTRRAWGIGWICSFGIPVLTIVAFILFSIIFSILIVLPGFAWMLLLKFCIPVPKRSG
jgi:hypothetical protein